MLVRELIVMLGLQTICTLLLHCRQHAASFSKITAMDRAQMRTAPCVRLCRVWAVHAIMIIEQ